MGRMKRASRAAVGLGGLLGLGLLLFAALAHAKTVTLNLKGADINAVIATVAEATGKNFIVDPRVKGKVTIVSAKPLSADQVYQVFLAMLEVHGYAAVPAGPVIKIVPDAEAKHSGTPPRGDGEELVTQVVEVRHVAATQLVPILRPLVPPQGHLAAHAQTNTLVIADRASNVARLLRIIERIDQPSGGEIEVVPLEHASASEVVRVLNSLQQARQKKEPKSQRPTLVADERTNSILIGGDRAARLQLKTIIAHLDTPSETVGNTHVIYLRYAQAKELVPVLTGVGKLQAKKGQKGKKTFSSGNLPFNIQADEATNALVITAPPDVMRSLKTVIQQLDVRRAQVLVEAVIAEVSMSKAIELGVQWIAGGENPGEKPVGVVNLGNNSIVNIAGAAAQKQVPPIGPGLSLGIGRIVDGGYSFAALINALASDASTNVLSTPTLITMDNEEAEIFVGQEVTVPTGSYAVTGGTGGAAVTNPFVTFKPKKVGIRLKVKPQINEGDAIKLDLEQTVDSITSGTAGQADLVTSQRSLKTSVIVDDNAIVVLGGLITDDVNDTVQKVPLLGDLPVLGNLFRFKRTNKVKTNLMIFLRPVILRDQAVTAAVTHQKYSLMRTKQLQARQRGAGLLPGEGTAVLPPLEDYLAAPPGSGLNGGPGQENPSPAVQSKFPESGAVLGAEPPGGASGKPAPPDPVPPESEIFD